MNIRARVTQLATDVVFVCCLGLVIGIIAVEHFFDHRGER
jgi:hypothetical protein